MTFPILSLLSVRDSHIKPDSEAGGLIWVEGWYQGRYWKFHVIIYLSHILHWLFSSIDFYMAEKIFGLTNCENKFLKEFPLSNLQIFLFRVLYKCFVKSTQHIDIWMQIPIQDDVYIWANYSVSSYLNFIPIFWNVLIWLKYDFTIFPCTLTYLFWDQVADTRSYIRGQIRIFEGQYGYMRANNQHWLLAIIGHAKTNILQQNMW
jgi:hypothetical protein